MSNFISVSELLFGIPYSGGGSWTFVGLKSGLVARLEKK